VIAKAISLGPIADSVALMEGFNENLTISQVGVDPKVAYLYREVPAARALEKLCQLTIGQSLTEAYASGSHENFAQILQNLSDRLLLLDAIASPEYGVAEQYQLIEVVQDLDTPIQNKNHAAQVIDELRSTQTSEALIAALKAV